MYQGVFYYLFLLISNSYKLFLSHMYHVHKHSCLLKFSICIAFPSNIVTQPTDTSAAAPFSGVFTCSVIGYGYQNITWYKQSGTLPHKYKTNEMMSYGVVTSSLVIPNVIEKDIGKYYCQIWANNIGVRSEMAYLYHSGMCLYT